MSFQLHPRCEHFSTLGALVRVGGMFRLDVQPQGLAVLEGRVTHVAFERPLLRVSLHVLQHIRVLMKRPTASLADKRFGVRVRHHM